MIKRVHIALAALLVILAGVIGWQGLRLREPVYQGTPLSAWLEIPHTTSPGTFSFDSERNEHARMQAMQAIRHIGTNALPVLIKRLHTQDSRLKQVMMTWAAKQKVFHVHFKSAQQRREEAVFGYGALGPMASAQVPSLSESLTNDPSPDVRFSAVSALECIGPEARLAAPALFRVTKDTNQEVRREAFAALARIVPDPRLTIPILVAGLGDPYSAARGNAAIALGSYGQEAKLAAPALFRAAKDTDGWVRCAALSSLGNIRADPQITIPLLVAGLDDIEPVARQSAAIGLGEYGPEARAAVPALLRMLETKKAGNFEYDAARAALKKIDPEAAVKAGVK